MPVSYNILSNHNNHTQYDDSLSIKMTLESLALGLNRPPPFCNTMLRLADTSA